MRAPGVQELKKKSLKEMVLREQPKPKESSLKEYRDNILFEEVLRT